VSVLAAHEVSSTLWLLFATGVGVLFAFEFGAPGLLGWRVADGRATAANPHQATFYGFENLALVLACRLRTALGLHRALRKKRGGCER